MTPTPHVEVSLSPESFEVEGWLTYPVWQAMRDLIGAGGRHPRLARTQPLELACRGGRWLLHVGCPTMEDALWLEVALIALVETQPALAEPVRTCLADNQGLFPLSVAREVAQREGEDGFTEMVDSLLPALAAVEEIGAGRRDL